MFFIAIRTRSGVKGASLRERTATSSEEGEHLRERHAPPCDQGAPLFEKEVLSRRGIDLTVKILSDACGRMAHGRGSRSRNRRSLQAEFLLALGNVYHAEGKRQRARDYLLVAIRTRPTVLLKQSSLSLGLKATAPAPLILAIRRKRTLQGSRNRG